MTNVINVDTLEQLRQFLNDKGVLELAIRNKQKRFSAFQQIALNNISQGEEKELMKQALNLMSKNNSIGEKSLKMINNVAKLQQLSLVLNGLNLCATCVGFAIMYAKLDNVSGQINQLMSVVKQGNGVQADYEFKKVISEHSNMLDSRKTQKYYTEEQMRKLVDDEFNVLNMLIDIFMRNLSEDQEGLVFSIYSLASMLAVSLRYFDELYYFNNRSAIGDGEVWHSSHDNWMAVYDKLISNQFIKNIQDHGIFDLNLNTLENDAYYLSLYDQVKELIEDVSDNQILIKTLDNEELLYGFAEYVKKDIVNIIQSAFEHTDGAIDSPVVVKAYQDAMKQVALIS